MNSVPSSLEFRFNDISLFKLELLIFKKLNVSKDGGGAKLGFIVSSLLEPPQETININTIEVIVLFIKNLI
jgi:hypothetical protein